jgi:hypothetical protein
MLEVLAVWKCMYVDTQKELIKSCLDARPKKMEDWVEWIIQTEQTMRMNGIDLREILVAGWTHHPILSDTLIQWSRLGGGSCRDMFFNAVYQILCAEGIVK